MREIRNILVPVDFSDASLEAFDRACDMARSLKAGLTVVSVAEIRVETSEGGKIMFEGPLTAKEMRTFFNDRVLLSTGRTPEALRLSLKILARAGSPVNEILRAAEQSSAEMIVMGVEGKAGAALSLRGGVAEGVIQGAACPVLIQRSNSAGVHDISEDFCHAASISSAAMSEGERRWWAD